jgi:hypothetical protein
MTVQQAADAGVSDGKVRWYVKLGFVTAEIPAVGESIVADEDEAA